MQYEYVECLSHLPRNFQMTYDILPALGIEEKLCRFDCVWLAFGSLQEDP